MRIDEDIFGLARATEEGSQSQIVLLVEDAKQAEIFG